MKPHARSIKIAVTGAAGFIGRHVLAELATYNLEVIAVARPGRRVLPSLPNVRWINVDIAQPLSDAFEVIQKPDILIHLAWQGLPNYGSLHHFETELPLQYAFLKQLVSQGLSSLVVTGTCFEYGMQSGPLSENLETRPENPYGFAKDVLRKQLVYLQAIHPFNLTWARLFYIFGDGQPSTSLLPQLQRAIQDGAEEFNMSGGEQLRDYLPVGEVARQLAGLAYKQKDIGAVNVCSGKPQSVRGLVERWISENKWNIKPNLGHYPYPDYEPMAFWGDSRKLEAALEA